MTGERRGALGTQENEGVTGLRHSQQHATVWLSESIGRWSASFSTVGGTMRVDKGLD